MTTDGRDETGSASGAGRGPVSILKCGNCGASNSIAPSRTGAPHCGKCGKPLPWLVNADEQSFELEVNAAPTVVVDLWAPWCGPCRIIGPILEEMSREYAGHLKVVKVNVDDNQGLAIRHQALSIPTLLVMKDGTVVDRIVGAMPKPQLTAKIAPHLKPPKSPAASDTT